MKLLKQLFKRSTDTHPNQERGALGEAAAAQHLKKSGLKILVKRYRCRYGEIDLVARDKDTLVFIEVKTRESTEYGEPFHAVTEEKQKHFSRVALDYLRKLRNPRIPVRFDIVEVISDGDLYECQHTPNAFSLSEPYLY